MSEDKKRIEKDSMGEFYVPESAMYGASTARAVENFQISNLRFSRTFIRALGEIKRACAIVNEKEKLLDKKIAQQIVKSADLVIKGEFDEDFVVDIFQTGSGTSTNMNINEIIARHASVELGQPVHPNDHVNMSQSSNDVIPSATNIAVIIHLVGLQKNEGLEYEIEELKTALADKAKKWKKVYKNGRTHLMDATPVTFGQVFEGFRRLIENHSIISFFGAGGDVGVLPIGGTAVGTGINAPKNFSGQVVSEINQSFLPLKSSVIESDTGLFSDLGGKENVGDYFARQGSRDEIARLSGELKALAVSLFKIANDIRWMGSGPVSGLGELKLPPLQPGSSIMPGKVNPVMPEMMMQVATQVIGNDTAITFAATQGNFELNAMQPVIAHNILESIEILRNGIKAFNEKCIQGLEVNEKKLLENVEKNPILVTALVPKLGYDVAAEIAKEAMETNKTIKEIVLNKGLMSETEIDKVLNISKLV